MFIHFYGIGFDCSCNCDESTEECSNMQLNVAGRSAKCGRQKRQKYYYLVLMSFIVDDFAKFWYVNVVFITI